MPNGNNSERRPQRLSVNARITVSSGDVRTVDVRVDGTKLPVAVPVKLFTHFTEQFVRSNPSEGFEKRYQTLMKLMEAAYKQGVADAVVVQSSNDDK